MKRLSRDTWLVVFLLFLLVALTVLATIWEARDSIERPALASDSTQPNGAHALWLWLEELGYRPDDTVSSTSAIPQEADLAFVLEPELPGITEQEWESIDEWVEAGGTLVVAGEGFGTAFSLQHYDFAIDYLDGDGHEASWATPLFASPASGLENVGARAVLSSDRQDFTPIVTVEGQPAMVGFIQGDGLVVLSTLTYPLTNEGLRLSQNARLALNLITLAGDGGTVWFDEWHHGRRGLGTETAQGPGNWIRQTPAGRALLYAAVVAFIALVLNGRLFGRPVPLPEEQQRRAPIEHLTAIANLNRRAGHRRIVLQRYHRELKRELGRRYGVPTSLPDDEFVERLTAHQPELDGPELAHLLSRMRDADVGEREMLLLAQQVTEWLAGRNKQ
jgi:hypothetical protein